MEVEAHLVAVEQLGYVAAEDWKVAYALRGTVGRLLNALLRALRSKPERRPDP